MIISFMITPLCHICNEELGNDRVRDHCHLSCKFRCAAHEVCNLKYKVPRFSHSYFTIYLAMIATSIKSFGNSERHISCIPNNEENDISFTKQVLVDQFVNNEGKEVNVNAS